MTKLHLSVQDRKLAGVCGGLGESTGIDSDLVRAAFLLSIFIGGMGLLLYLILWIVLPEMEFEGKSKKKGIFDGLKRCEKDRMLAGVCAGIANYLDWDVSIIRILLIVIILAGGIGVPLYVILWVLMPMEEEE
jgi:phage shock protein PspC (stress-responsive transcriptional regulator)